MLAEKKAAYAGYRAARDEMKELLIHKNNIDHILGLDERKMEGAKRVDRARDYLWQALWGGGVLLAVLSVPVVLFAPRLALLFVKNQTVAAIVGGYFSVVSVGYVLNTLTNCLLGTVNGLGAPAKSMWCMVLYYIIIRMPLAYLLAKLGFGLGGIWVAVLASHAVAALAAAFLAAALLRRGGTGPAKQGLPSVRHEA